MIRTERAHLLIAAQSHPGMTGKNNEDRYAVSAYRASRINPTPSLIAVLCDGIGGHRAGEVAAEIAVETISQKLAESSPGQPLEALKSAVTSASQAIFKQAGNEDGRMGMGSTLACAWVVGHRLYTTSVGDSRIYLLRGNTIQQLTTDHTWIQEALEAGLINAQQIRGHPNAHVIRRYLGSPTPPLCDFRLRLSPEENDEQALANQGLVLKPGDKLLLCSDGLTDLVSNQEILRVAQSQAFEAIPDALIALANQRGGFDNITVILLAAPWKSISRAAAIRQWALRYWWLLLIALLTIGILIAVVAMLWMGFDLISRRPGILPLGTTTPLIQPTPLLMVTPTAQPFSPTPPTGQNPASGAPATATPIQPTVTPLTAPTKSLPTSTPIPITLAEEH